MRQKISDEEAVVFHARRGDRICGFRDVELQVLHPSGDTLSEKNINNDDLVLKISYQGVRFLLTGDLEESAMADILRSGADIGAEVLKVPHHGAKLRRAGADFIRAVNPKISVISVGLRNSFHHPSEQTLEILSSVPGNQIVRTDLDGAVQIAVEDAGLSVQRKSVDSLTAG